MKPMYGSVWYHFADDDRERARMHKNIAVPGATTQSTGLVVVLKELPHVVREPRRLEMVAVLASVHGHANRA